MIRAAFIGTGVMGGSMAMNLIRAGIPLTVFNRSRDKAQRLIDAGAVWADTPSLAARDAEFVFTIVSLPSDVRAVYLGDGGLVETAAPNAVLIDMTTSSPSLAVEIAAAAEARGLSALDAPVSGGDIGARDGTLSIMVGGDDNAFRRALPLFQAMGKTINRQGGPGAGQHTKMCNQINIASTLIGVFESLLYAKRAGLDPETVLRSIGAGAAASWSLNHLFLRADAGDFNPGFYVEHFVKDMNIALAETVRMGLHTPGLRLARDLYVELISMGGERQGTQALYRVLAAAAETQP